MMTDSELKPLGLPGKIAKIMGEMQRIPKSGHNSVFNYDFPTEGDVSDVVRTALAKYNIAFFASLTSWTKEPTGATTKSGRLIVSTVCNFEFTFIDGDSGETKTCLWSGEAQDDQDKGISKAATAAEKYFLLKTFMISTGDPKDDSDNALRRKAQPQQQQRQNAPQPPQNEPDAAPATVISPERKQALGDAFAMCRDLYDMYTTEAEQKRTFMADVTILEQDGKLAVGSTDAKLISTAIHFDLMQPANGKVKA